MSDVATETANPPAASKWLRYAVRGVVLAMAVSVFVFVSSVDEGTWDHLRAFRWGYLPILIAMVTVAWSCNAVRTWLLCRVLGHRLKLRQALGVTLSTEFATSASPGGIGGLATRIFLQKRLGIETAETMSMVAADVCADIVFFTALTPFAATALWHLLRRIDLNRMTEGRGPFFAIGAVIVVSLVALAIWRMRRAAKASRAAAATAGGPPALSWSQRLVHGSRDFLQNLRAFYRRGKRLFVLNVAVASLQWLCRYGVLPVAFLAFGIKVEILPMLLLQGLLFLMGIFVILPGGGGTIELLSSVILPLLAPASVVALVVIVWRAFTYHIYLVVGGMVMWRVMRQPAPAAVEN